MEDNLNHWNLTAEGFGEEGNATLLDISFENFKVRK